MRGRSAAGPRTSGGFRTGGLEVLLVPLLVLLLVPLLPAAAPRPVSAQSLSAGELPDLECLRLMRRARIAEVESHFESAVELLERARETCNEPTAALIGLLRADRRNPLPRDEAQQVRRDLIAAIDDPSTPPPPGVLEFIARSEEADEEVLQAASALVERRLLEDGPDRGRLLRLKALLDQQLGRSADATLALIELRRLEPENEEIAWALLRLFSLQQRWDEAADQLGELVEGGDTAMRPHYVRALARAGRVDEVKRQLELLAEELDPNDRLALVDHAADVLTTAWTLRDSGRPAEAEEMFRLAQKVAPAGSWTGAEAEKALVHLYGTAEERTALRHAAADRWQHVTDAHLLLNEGANQVGAGNYDRALELLERAAEELGHLEAVWFNMGVAAYRSERWEKAVEALDRAAELNTQRADSVFYSGLAMVQLERWDEAVPRLLRSVELDPRRRHAHYQLWVCYRMLDQEVEAARHLAAYEALAER